MFRYIVSVLGGVPLPPDHLLQGPGHALHQVHHGLAVLQPRHPQIIELSFLVLQVCCSGVLNQTFYSGLDILDRNRFWAVVWPLFVLWSVQM